MLIFIFKVEFVKKAAKCAEIMRKQCLTDNNDSVD